MVGCHWQCFCEFAALQSAGAAGVVSTTTGLATCAAADGIAAAISRQIKHLTIITKISLL